jgi:putative Ca2+/H+ antiporter (TMEM165/GDT1 family)
VTSAFLIAFLLVALAELSDKSQLLLLGFAARYRPIQVLAGAAIAIAALQLLAVALGRTVGVLLPERLTALVAGAVFVVFGLLTWQGRADDADDNAPRRFALGPVLTVAAAFFLAEFGDKTQIMTVSVAADPAAALRTLGWLAPHLQAPDPGSGSAAAGVWLGSFAGMLLVDGVAIAFGVRIAERFAATQVRRFSAIVFVLFGLLSLGSAVLNG